MFQKLIVGIYLILIYIYIILYYSNNKRSLYATLDFPSIKSEDAVKIKTTILNSRYDTDGIKTVKQVSQFYNTRIWRITTLSSITEDCAFHTPWRILKNNIPDLIKLPEKTKSLYGQCQTCDTVRDNTFY